MSQRNREASTPNTLAKKSEDSSQPHFKTTAESEATIDGVTLLVTSVKKDDLCWKCWCMGQTTLTSDWSEKMLHCDIWRPNIYIRQSNIYRHEIRQNPTFTYRHPFRFHTYRKIFDWSYRLWAVIFISRHLHFTKGVLLCSEVCLF